MKCQNKGNERKFHSTRIVVQGQPRQKVCENPISKIIRVKWTGGVAQAKEKKRNKAKVHHWKQHSS
jgi:hypothetical protein